MLSEAIRSIEAGNLEEADALCQRMLGENQGHAQALYLLGVVYHQRGSLEEAEKYLTRALSFSPDFVEAHGRLGIVLCEQGRYKEAIERYRKLLTYDDSSPEVYATLAGLLSSQGSLEEAVIFYEKALSLKPDFPEVYNDMAVVFHRHGFLAEASACCKKALSLKPDYLKALRNLGMILHDLGDTEGAIDLYRRAQAIGRDDAIAVRIAMMVPAVMQSREEILRYRRNYEKSVDDLLKGGVTIKDPVNEIGRASFYFAYHGMNDRLIQKKTAAFYENTCPSLLFQAPHCCADRGCPDGKIRIGFVSRHLKNHTVGKYVRGIIANLSRKLFHVVVFTFPEGPDEISLSIQANADKVVKLPTRLERARGDIAQERPDILFYPDIGMEPMTYFLAYARLAPVQCCFYGHPVTTGIPNIDYFISHEDCEVEGAEDHYSETLVRLPTHVAYTYYYRPGVGETFKKRRDYGLPEDIHIYFCPQSLFKLHPDFDAIAAKILRGDPKGILLLAHGEHVHWVKLIRERFARTGPELLERTVFLPKQSYSDYLGLVSLSDVILDTPHFNGGATTFDALAVGAPVVTLPGQFMRGRQTYSLYKRMGIMSCVAHSIDEYVDIALSLAGDISLRQAVKEAIMANNHLIFEDEGMVRELEILLVRMIEERGLTRKDAGK